jgi:hypothetical protein
VSPRALPLAVLPLLLSLAWATASAFRARVDPRFSGFRARALIALLTYLGPLVRGVQRYLWRVRGLGEVQREHFEERRQPVQVDWKSRSFTVSYWSGAGHEKEALLGGLMDFLVPRKYLVTVDPGWNPFDLEVYRGIWAKARVTVAAENHGGPKRVLNVRGELRWTRVSRMALLGYAILVGAGLLFHVPEIVGVGAALGLVNLGVTVSECVRLGQVLRDALDIVAERAGLAPLRPSQPTPRPARARA